MALQHNLDCFSDEKISLTHDPMSQIYSILQKYEKAWSILWPDYWNYKYGRCTPDFSTKGFTFSLLSFNLRWLKPDLVFSLSHATIFHLSFVLQIRSTVKCESTSFKAVLCCGQRQTPDFKTFKSYTGALKRSQRSNLKRPGVVCTTDFYGVMCMWCVYQSASQVYANTDTHTHKHTLE